VIGFPPTTSNENDCESLRAGLLTNSFPCFKEKSKENYRFKSFEFVLLSSHNILKIISIYALSRS
jgi:hypothetical protein